MFRRSSITEPLSIDKILRCKTNRLTCYTGESGSPRMGVSERLHHMQTLIATVPLRSGLRVGEDRG